MKAFVMLELRPAIFIGLAISIAIGGPLGLQSNAKPQRTLIKKDLSCRFPIGNAIHQALPSLHYSLVSQYQLPVPRPSFP